MKAITLWPEWCWAIRQLGKNVENRSWRPPDTLRIGESIAIHAGASFGGKTGESKTWSRIFDPIAGIAQRSCWNIRIDVMANIIVAYNVLSGKRISDRIVTMPCGGVVAVATFDGTLVPGREESTQWPWWADDQFGWVLRDVTMLPKIVRCTGRQRLWNLSREIEEAVVIQLRKNSAPLSDPPCGCGHKGV